MFWTDVAIRQKEFLQERFAGNQHCDAFNRDDTDVGRVLHALQEQDLPGESDGKTCDQYTVVFSGRYRYKTGGSFWYVGMSEYPASGIVRRRKTGKYRNTHMVPSARLA